MTARPSEREARERAMKAFGAEIDRQCGIGAGEAHTDSETGLLEVHASIDPFGMAEAFLAFAVRERAEEREACAQVADSDGNAYEASWQEVAARRIAHAIRNPQSKEQ